MALDRLGVTETVGETGIAERDEVGLPREAYSLLAQANLFRMRGGWDEAVQNCMAALRLAPDSPSAQSLLGDIYENQGRIDEAIQWYRMALDANPDSPADRLKLNRLLERQQAPLRQFAEESLPSGSAKRLSKSVPTPLIHLWQISQEPETALRYGALIAATLVFFTVAFAYGAVHHRAALAALGLGGPREVQIKPVVVPPASNPSADAVADVPHDSAEQAILDSLRHGSDLRTSGISVFDVQSDPRTARLTITIGLSSAGTLNRVTILRAAMQTVQDAAPLSPSSVLFSVRCLALPAGADGAGGVSLAFSADLTRTVLPGPTTLPDDSQIQTLFTNPWWSPQLPS